MVDLLIESFQLFDMFSFLEKFSLQMHLFFWILIITCFDPIRAQQYYDPSNCSTDLSHPGSRYTCKSDQKPCSTYLVYRANQRFNSILNISHLLRADTNDLLRANNLSASSEILESGRDVLVPVTCSCIGNFFQANFSYMVSENTTLSEVACVVFEGLVKLHTLAEENSSQDNDVKVGTMLHLPLRCACPDNGVMHLVTYPLIEGDELNVLSKKFGISPTDIWAANHFDPFPTVYPNTTILIPLKNISIINFNIPNSPPPTPGFLSTITVENSTSAKLITLYISISVIGFFLIVAALVLCLWYAKTLSKRKIDKLVSFNLRSSPLSCSTVRSSPRSAQTGRSSANSCLSPDLLIGIKYSLKNYTIEDLRKATNGFSEVSKIEDKAYKASMDDVEVMIKHMSFEDTRQVIDVHTKINHINIVNLLGVCYNDSDFCRSYLVFELPSNGCLRNWLSNSSSSLRWHRRIQIAFDIATGLHYLHYCIFPSYAHMGVNSRDIFITENWRAKLTNIRTNGTGSDKVDIFEFGVVLLEIISGKVENEDGKSLKDGIGFLGGSGNASEGGCFDQLRSFMDPCLKDDYPLAEALCLAVLAKACVEDDPQHRPSMDDMLKVLVRLV